MQISKLFVPLIFFLRTTSSIEPENCSTLNVKLLDNIGGFKSIEDTPLMEQQFCGLNASYFSISGFSSGANLALNLMAFFND